jgi:hypothetical protein
VFWSAGHSETKSKHLTGILYVGQKNILFYLFAFLPGPFQGGHFFASNNLFGQNETPLPKPPPPPCSAAISAKGLYRSAQKAKRVFLICPAYFNVVF